MADVQIGAKLSLDASQATNSVKSFKTELNLAQQQVVEMAAKFGATSKEAAEAANRAAELKDAVGDAKSLVDAFNPDTKFRAFGAAINTVVGGFTALTGVLGLVGVESKEVQEALLKVQSALALSQGISQLQEGIQTFKNLGAVIQQTTLFQKANAVATSLAAGAMRLLGISTTATSTSMQILKGAIIATGIGALVVLLGVAADAMGLFSSSTDDAAKKQEELKASIESTNNALQDQINFANNAEELEIARAKRRGATEEEIFQIEQNFRRAKFNATQRAYNQIAQLDKEQGARLLQQLEDLNTEGQVAQINFDIEEQKRREEAHKKRLEQEKRFLQELLKERQADLERQAANFAARGGPAGGLNIGIPKSTEQLQIEATVAAAAKARDDKQAIWLQESDARSSAYNAQKDQIKALEEAELIAYTTRKELLTSTGQLFTALGAIVGQQTAAGKILGIAQATINTFIGATEVLRSPSVIPEPGATISKIANVAAVIATGLAAVKNIIKTPVPGAAGGNVPSVGAPLQPQKPEIQTTQLDQQSLNAIGNATTRAFVLESDVTNNQERVRRLNRAARLGG